MEDTKKIMEVAMAAAREAGEYALKRLGSVIEISHKGGKNNLVTDVDKASEEIVIRHIRENFPEHSILAEESGRSCEKNDYMWIIDPLDGTTNYAHAFPFFCVSIGVLYRQEVVIGVVYNPNLDELFTAEKGKGAFLNSNPINVSATATVEASLLATGFQYDPVERLKNLKYMGKVLEVAQAIRRAGAAALDLSYVACGRFDGFWEQGLKPWDTSAGYLIINEAGGTISTMDNGTYDIYQKDIVATNGKIHSQLLSILNKP